MANDISAERSETNVPLTLSVGDKDGPVSGLTATVRVRDGNTSNSFLDFADDTFKTAGHTTLNAALAEIGSSGVYTLSGGLNLSTITNLPAATEVLFAEYEFTGTRDGVALDTIQIRSTVGSVQDVVDALLARRRIDTSDANQWQLVLYDSDNTTEKLRKDLKDRNGAAITDTNNPLTDSSVLIAEEDPV